MSHTPRRLAPALTLALLGLLSLLAGCTHHGPVPGPAPTALPVGSSTGQVVVGGTTRSYRVHRPAALPARAPVVVMLHGGFGSAAQAEQSYGWDQAADAGHFVVVYPDGLDRAWNAGGGCCGTPGRQGTDDVAFVADALAAVERQVPVDTRRVYATGISNGGMMAYRLACDTRLFAAVGVDSGTLLGNCAAPAPVSVLHIHGTADHNIPYLGGPGQGPARIDGPPVPQVVAGWRTTDDCAAPTGTTAGPVTTLLATCPDGRAVELLTIAGAGHQWPGSPDRPVLQRVLGLDTPSRALDATAVFWSFFAAHPAP
ncbi:extracellular catalytic domain type 1 short-chain-length polyhydroxyalkanoate depolymerase [Streptacidiphilus jiangxiensis]|uniref:Polyhydroxybutyrate depolymerase n=1 Tax=Streptacidiphilus jiangxiensis TaxID=235985 RepID=A0A1H7IBD2_STRJI|nr:PHB depolymerase family esterase [Streptacidiphilus jiangxiensis]SEK59789.1 polyhydroxybutyrate depolymerase [Streptacidiphilus jiangxiensis]